MIRWHSGSHLHSKSSTPGVVARRSSSGLSTAGRNRSVHLAPRSSAGRSTRNNLGRRGQDRRESGLFSFDPPHPLARTRLPRRCQALLGFWPALRFGHGGDLRFAKLSAGRPRPRLLGFWVFPALRAAKYLAFIWLSCIPCQGIAE